MFWNVFLSTFSCLVVGIDRDKVPLDAAFGLKSKFVEIWNKFPSLDQNDPATVDTGNNASLLPRSCRSSHNQRLAATLFCPFSDSSRRFPVAVNFVQS